MYWNTKEYMSDHLVKPVLSRANSMKNLSHAVLDSRVSNYAADRLDGALNVCDKYVERFLPAEDQPDGKRFHNGGTFCYFKPDLLTPSCV